MPKIKRPKNGWSAPKKRRSRRVRIAPSKLSRSRRCSSCGQFTVKKDERRGENYCSSCGVIA